MESIRAFGSKFFSLRVDLILEGVAGGGGGQKWQGIASCSTPLH